MVYNTTCAQFSPDVAQFGRALALGQIIERRLWRIQRDDLCAAVDKIEDQRKPEDFIGHRKPAVKPRMPRGVLFSATKQFTGLFCLRLVFTPTKQKSHLVKR